MEAIQRFEKPGLYRIVNIASSTALDLSSDNATIQGWPRPNRKNTHQDWMIASISKHKYMILNAGTGTCVRARGKSQPVIGASGEYHNAKSHWFIEHDKDKPERIFFKSVKFPDCVLELEGGREDKGTRVYANPMSPKNRAQEWGVQKMDYKM